MSNKQSVKLYTEEQLHNTVIAVSNYLDDINLTRAQENIEKHLKALEPIKLPSDEEIEERYLMELEQRKENAHQFTGQIAGRHPDMFGHSEILHMVRGYLECAKWMRDKIQGSNK